MYKVTFLVLLTAALGVAQLDVAFMITDQREYWAEAIGFFENDGRFDDVDFYYCREGSTPPLGAILLYDVVVVGGVSEYWDPVVFGDRLADYVDQGGCVVVEAGKVWTWLGIEGRWRDEGYCPYYSENTDWIEGYQDLIIDEPGHEIFDGVSGLWDSYWRADTILRSGAVELAHFPDTGGVAINARENVAATNYTPHIGHRWTGDGYLIMANAACYPAGYSEVREASRGQIKATF